jgi:hypothetical protein
MTWLAGIIPALLQWLFSGTVTKQVAHTDDQLAQRGLDQKTLTGIPPKLCVLLGFILAGYVSLYCCGCSVVKVDFGQTKSNVYLALAEPADVAIITCTDSLPVIVTTKAGAVTTQVQSAYNCAGMVALPKSVYRALREKAYPQAPLTVTMVSQPAEIPLANATVTVSTIIVEAGEPIEIATDTIIACTIDGKEMGQNCAGMYALKLSVYRAMRAQAYPEVKP